MKKMCPARYLLLVVVVLLLSVFEASGDDVIPSKCEPPCQQLPPPSPPLSGYPSYGALPPPPPSDFSIYGAPPPPREKGGQSKCPPSGEGAGTGVQCCTPPNTYIYAPPNPYTYVPYGEGLAPRLLLPLLAPLMTLFSCFIFLF